MAKKVSPKVKKQSSKIKDAAKAWKTYKGKKNYRQFVSYYMKNDKAPN